MWLLKIHKDVALEILYNIIRLNHNIIIRIIIKYQRIK